jgi:hypothetical protein
MEAFFHQGEQYCVPQILPCSADPGYPAQVYTSTLPVCPTVSPTIYSSAPFNMGVPTGTQDGPVPTTTPPLPVLVSPDI